MIFFLMYIVESIRYILIVGSNFVAPTFGSKGETNLILSPSLYKICDSIDIFDDKFLCLTVIVVRCIFFTYRILFSCCGYTQINPF